MPYIAESDRQYFGDVVRSLRDVEIEQVGELNYLITMVINRFMAGRPFRYQAINDVLGALEGAKQEFYRRVAAPYEDKKLAVNGDVYGDKGQS